MKALALKTLRSCCAALTLCATCGFSFSDAASLPVPGKVIYVSPSGNDTANGTAEHPLATLEGARDLVRKLKASGGLPAGGVAVELAEGMHKRKSSFKLGKEDSGEADKPIVYRAAEGAAVSICGGEKLDKWEPFSSGKGYDLLPETAKGKVLVADLGKVFEKEVPDFKPYGFWAGGAAGRDNPNANGAWLYYKNAPMRPASWPSEEGSPIVGIPADSKDTFRDEPCNKEGKFMVDPDRAKVWAKEEGLWCRGYFAVMYADSNHAIKSIDSATGMVEVLQPYHYYGYKKDNPTHGGRRTNYFIANALSELDQPGEFRIDRKEKKAYLWPTGNIQAGDVIVAAMSEPLVEITDGSAIVFLGLTFEATRNAGILVTGGEGVSFRKCVVRNMGDYGLRIKDGKKHSVIGCDVSGMSDGGIMASGGERKTLATCEHLIENCYITNIGLWNRTYVNGVNAAGVGVTTRNCLFNNMPHVAYRFDGNDHIFEYNEIHSVSRETTEAGAIYTGRDWASYGNRIDFNYVHDIYGPHTGEGIGIHLDDAASGISFYGNIFTDMRVAIYHCGGRSIKVKNNIFIDCVDALWLSYRKMASVEEKLKKLPYQQAPWSTRFPEIVNTLEDMPDYPRNCELTNNINSGRRFIRTIKGDGDLNNLQSCFKNTDNREFPVGTIKVELVDGRPSVKLPKEFLQSQEAFKEIPTEKIGLYASPLRASWPVKNELAPKPGAWRKNAGKPTIKAIRARQPITIDGVVNVDEWRDTSYKENWGTNPNEMFRINQTALGNDAPYESYARARHDGKFIYLSFEIPGKPAEKLNIGKVWGECEAAEVAFRKNPSGKSNDNPTIILRGFADSSFVSSTEGGATEQIAKQAESGVMYRAKVDGKGSWSAEWKIPFASLGLNAEKDKKLLFNATIRKTSGIGVWLMWTGTGTTSWYVEHAGIMELVD